jgi:hypothetical protein
MSVMSVQSPACLEEKLPEVLTRIVAELYDVAYLIERVEPQLLDLGTTGVAGSPDSMKVLQGIDLAVQKTRGLAEFVDTLAGTIPEHWTVDVSTALALVKLADMHRALSPGMIQPAAMPLSKAAGDLDFF